MQITAGGVQIEVEVQGPAHGEPILLIMGLGMQLTGWPDEIVQLLVQRGFRVIRHDNRDVGLSEGFDSIQHEAAVEFGIDDAVLAKPVVRAADDQFIRKNVDRYVLCSVQQRLCPA